MSNVTKILEALRYPDSVGVLYQGDLIRDIQDALDLLSRLQDVQLTTAEMQTLLVTLDHTHEEAVDAVDILKRLSHFISL